MTTVQQLNNNIYKYNIFFINYELVSKNLIECLIICEVVIQVYTSSKLLHI